MKKIQRFVKDEMHKCLSYYFTSPYLQLLKVHVRIKEQACVWFYFSRAGNRDSAQFAKAKSKPLSLNDSTIACDIASDKISLVLDSDKLGCFNPFSPL